jgi:hypothetical protein
MRGKLDEVGADHQATTPTYLDTFIWSLEIDGASIE